MKPIKLNFKNEASQSINDLLLSKGFSPSNIYHLINEKHVLVNDLIIEGKNYLLSKDDLIEVTLNDEINELLENDSSLDIKYEDEYILIVNKPNNLDVEPSRYTRKDNLASMVTYYFNKHDIKSKVHLVNRLDKLTSGLVIISKNQYIKNLFTKTKIIKKYKCLVKGICAEKGEIDIAISKAKGTIHTLSNKGKKCKTTYKLLDVIDGNSLLEVEIFTGRTHQIRLSMKSIDHPLIGDPLYGENDGQKMYLESYYLEFIHPITNQLIKIQI